MYSRLLCALGLCFFLGFTAKIQAQTQVSNQPQDINMKFYHLEVELDLDKPFIKGKTLCDFVTIRDNVKDFSLDLHQDLKVKTISEGKFEQKGNKLHISLDKALAKKETRHKITIEYEGVPPTAKDRDGVEKGLRYAKRGDKGQVPVIASVTYHNHAHFWFPCRDGLGDKVDSVYVDITIDDRKAEIINPQTEKLTKIPIIAISNGQLKGVENKEGKKTFRWRHYARIAPHHILLAVSAYAKQEAEYIDAMGKKIPLGFYFFPENFNQAQIMIARVPEILAYLEKTFGPYPFPRDGFSLTETGLDMGYDGMPTQANVLIQEIKGLNMYRAVNLASTMWYGNHISPLTWNDAWIYDAVSAYAEAMWQEYRRGLGVRQIILDEKEYFEPGKLYIEDEDTYSKDRLLRKGAYVIHMLRGLMGEVYFFETLRSIPAMRRKKDYYISTHDFQKIAEYYASENVEQDYSYFFKQWVYGEYYPEYTIKFENLKKGQVQVSINQTKHKTKPEIFDVATQLELVCGKEVKERRRENIRLDAAEKVFTFELPAPAEEVILDPEHWLLKKVHYTHQVLNSKTPLTDFSITTDNGRRDISIKFNSAKKQDVNIELIRLPEQADVEPEVLSNIPLNGVQGPVEKQFKIPLGPKERGVFALRIVGKSDIFTRVLRVKQLERMFE